MRALAGVLLLLASSVNGCVGAGMLYTGGAIESSVQTSVPGSPHPTEVRRRERILEGAGAAVIAGAILLLALVVTGIAAAVRLFRGRESKLPIIAALGTLAIGGLLLVFEVVTWGASDLPPIGGVLGAMDLLFGAVALVAVVILRRRHVRSAAAGRRAPERA